MKSSTTIAPSRQQIIPAGASGGDNGDKKPTRYIKWKEVEPNTVFSGIYTGSHTRDTDYGPSTTHYLDAGEEVLGLGGTKRLDDLFANIAKADEIDVEFLSKDKRKSKDGKVYFVNEFNVFRRI
jgi:hypothetical protein